MSLDLPASVHVNNHFRLDSMQLKMNLSGHRAIVSMVLSSVVHPRCLCDTRPSERPQDRWCPNADNALSQTDSRSNRWRIPGFPASHCALNGADIFAKARTMKNHRLRPGGRLPFPGRWLVLAERPVPAAGTLAAAGPAWAAHPARLRATGRVAAPLGNRARATADQALDAASAVGARVDGSVGHLLSPLKLASTCATEVFICRHRQLRSIIRCLS